MKTKKRIKIGIATTFVIVILMSLCGSRFVFQKACVRRETSWLNMGTADDYIYNLLVDAYNIRKEKNETVTIKASDGINLVGHYYERDKNAPLIIQTNSKSENLVSVTLLQSQRQERPHFTMWTKKHW